MKQALIVGAQPNSLIYKRGKRPIQEDVVGYSAQIVSGGNDAYEVVADGTVNTSDTLVWLGGYPGVAEEYVAAVRFEGVNIPQGESIRYAALRFVSGGGNGESCLLRVWAEDADNASPLAATTNNISNRTKTTAYVDWDVPLWSAGQDNDGTINEELAPLVQEVVNRPGWVPGNAIVFIIETSPAISDTTFPRRKAWSYEGSSGDAARIYVNTTEGSTPPAPSPAGDFSDGVELFGLEGNSSFNPASPTLKDGTAITGDMLTYYNAMMYKVANPAAGSTSSNIITRMQVLDSYNLGRDVQMLQTPMMNAFRLTGDLRILDLLVRAYDQLTPVNSYGLVNAWSGWTCIGGEVGGRDGTSCLDGSAGPDHPWSGYASVLYRGGGGTTWNQGTDLDNFNTFKFWAQAAEFTWALHQNRGKTSPAGYTYSTHADTWRSLLLDFVRTWSEDDTGSNPWRVNYQGKQSWPGGSGRAAWGTYPIATYNGSHSALHNVPLQRYIGLMGEHGGMAIANASDATASAGAIVDTFVGTSPIDGAMNAFPLCTSTYGVSRSVRSADWMTGTKTDPQNTTYFHYIAGHLTTLWLTGAYRTVLTQEMMNQIARQSADAHYTDGRAYGNINANVAKCGLTAGAGDTKSQLEQAIRGFAGMMVFENPSETTKLFTAATTAQNAAGGGYSTPGEGVLPAQQFLTLALREVGDIAF